MRLKRGKEVKSKLVEKPLLYVWYICHVSSFCQVLHKLAQVRVLQRVKKAFPTTTKNIDNGKVHG